jgi:hypothetical protein
MEALTHWAHVALDTLFLPRYQRELDPVTTYGGATMACCNSGWMDPAWA